MGSEKFDQYITYPRDLKLVNRSREETERLMGRIVNLYQPWVRPMVRGKDNANVEFGAKVNLSEVDGFVRCNHIGWDNYKEAGKFAVKLTVTNEKGESIKELENFIEVREYEHNSETLTDVRDGKEYKTIQIGNISIMAENLRYMTGDAFYYDNDPGYEEDYGLLYKWETAPDACQAGWRLPTRNEYEMIKDYLGGENEAGGKLKKSGTEYWLSPNEFGTNESGFSAVGSGGYKPEHLEFFGMYESATFWTQTGSDDEHVWSVSLSRKNGNMVIHSTTSSEEYYFSIRCIMD